MRFGRVDPPLCVGCFGRRKMLSPFAVRPSFRPTQPCTRYINLDNGRQRSCRARWLAGRGHAIA